MARHRRALGAIALAATGGLFAACVSVPPSVVPGETDPSEMRDVTIMLSGEPSMQHAAVYSAIERGYFEERNLRVKLVYENEIEDPFAELSSGTIDIAFTSTYEALVARSAGDSVSMVSQVYQADPMGVISRPLFSVDRASELRGRTIAVPSLQSEEYAALVSILAEDGLTPDDVEVREFGTGSRVAYLGGRVDAFVGYLDLDYEAVRRSPGLGGSDITMYGESTEFAAENGADATVARTRAQREAAGPPPTPFEPIDPTWVGPGLFVGDETLAEDRDMVRASIAAIQRAASQLPGDLPGAVEDARSFVPAIDTVEVENDAKSILYATIRLERGENGLSSTQIDTSTLERMVDRLSELSVLPIDVVPDGFVQQQ